MDENPLDIFATAAQALRDAGTALPPVPANHRTLRASILAVHAVEEWARVRSAELMADAEACEAWAGSGYRNAADWLAGSTKSHLGAAKRKTKLGQALKSNKKLKDAVDEGSVSPDAAEQLADTINTPPAGAGEEQLDMLVEACKGATPGDARDAASLFADTFKTETDEEATERRYQARTLTLGLAKDGMVPVTGSVPADMADQIKKAILHAAGEYKGDVRTIEQKLVDGLHHLAVAHAKGELGGGRGAPQMLITMSEAAYRGYSNEPAVTDLGTRIPAHEARRLAEIAELRRVVMRGSEVLDLGRTERYATVAQYQALVARDGCCSWEGCNIPAGWCDADHIDEWEHGGLTNLSQLRLLCPHHHKQRHRPGVTGTGDGTNWTLTLPDGTTIHRTTTPPVGQQPLFTNSGRPPDPTQAAA